MNRVGVADSRPSVKVSVATTTYNQESYIAQAIDSVLAQEPDFDFEYIISDDASTDRTSEILKDYQRRYPDRIQLFLREVNVGAQRNLADALARCTGQYVALLDGDDYWTRPDKLQKQVEFMDEHPDCALCFHDVRLVGADDRPSPAVSAARAATRFEIRDLLQENFISACTVMYRWGMVESLPDWWADTWIGDWPLHVLHAQHGWIGRIPESMAAYRVHEGGLWSGQHAPARADEYLETLRRLDETLGFRYHAVVEQVEFAHRYHELSESTLVVSALEAKGERAEARRAVFWLLGHIRHRGDVSIHQVVVLAIQGTVPALIPPLVALKALARRRRRSRS